MHSDAHFEIGRSHDICQDYALVGTPALAVISDGCSSSDFTDLGSRFLVLSTHQDPFSLPVRILDRAHSMAKAANLKNSCLDATLLYAYPSPSGIRVNAFGDGVVVAKHKDGSVEVWSIDFNKEAPAYLSYLLSQGRLAKYREEEKGKRTVTVTKKFSDGKIETHTKEDLVNDAEFIDLPFSLTFDPTATEAVFIFSDGIRSFRRDLETGGTEPVPLEEVLEQVLAIKSYNGEFMARRMKAFSSRFCREKGWHHYDDVSVGAIWCGE